jgi:prepilin-type N-terminal cleavage/methylation domain-containing protein
MNTSPQVAQSRTGFTLVEMLVVIAIIGLLAALLVGLAPTAVSKMRTSRIQGELASLETALSYYQTKKGYYPPDNTSMTTQSPLFYELTGTLQETNGFLSQQTMDSLSSANVTTLFNLPGFMNSTADQTELNSLNYYPGVRPLQYGAFSTNGVSYTLMGSQVPGPYTLKTTSGQPLNPWHYNSSHPTHNPNSYDLWIDITIRGQTNRISNWNKDPEVVGDFQQ